VNKKNTCVGLHQSTIAYVTVYSAYIGSSRWG
jgi:hypothetical protein